MARGSLEQDVGHKFMSLGVWGNPKAPPKPLFNRKACRGHVFVLEYHS